MKRLSITLCCLMLLVGSISARINLPQAETMTLDNGLTVKIIPRHSLPLISLQMTFRAGSIYDPAGKEGLANICNEMLMRGTADRSARQIAEDVSFGGGTLHNYCGREEAGLSGEFMADYFEDGLQILADILLNAAFAPDEFDKMKTRILAELESRLDNPSSMATENFYGAVLGDNPYAHMPMGRIATVRDLTCADALEFFRNVYTPDNCLLVICGDVDAQAFMTWIEKRLDGWAGRARRPAIVTAFAPVSGRDILLLDKQDASQTQIRFGGIGMPMNHPAYVPFEAARTVFAGSFTSRLMNEIRVKRGLTYGIRMRSPRYTPGGLVYISTFTKNASVGEVIDIILNETGRMHNEPLPDSELTGAINYRCGLYPLRFETNDDITGVYSDQWLYTLDKSYYEDFQENLRTVTAADVAQTAGTFFPLDNYRLILIGRADEVLPQIEKYGTVTVRPFLE